jgi:hypothetical protein
MTTATKLMNDAQAIAMAQRLYDTACTTIPARTVIVVADTDGFGKVRILAMPGVINGEGGTAEILAIALQQIGGASALDTDARAMYERVAKKLGLPVSEPG